MDSIVVYVCGHADDFRPLTKAVPIRTRFPKAAAAPPHVSLAMFSETITIGFCS